MRIVKRKSRFVVRRAAQARSGRLRAVGAYILQGMCTAGVAKHFDVVAQLEEGDFGVATTRANFPNMPIYHTKSNSWPVPGTP